MLLWLSFTVLLLHYFGLDATGSLKKLESEPIIDTKINRIQKHYPTMLEMLKISYLKVKNGVKTWQLQHTIKYATNTYKESQL